MLRERTVPRVAASVIVLYGALVLAQVFTAQILDHGWCTARADADRVAFDNPRFSLVWPIVHCSFTTTTPVRSGTRLAPVEVVSFGSWVPPLASVVALAVGVAAASAGRRG